MQKLRYILATILVVTSIAMMGQQAPMFTNYSNSYAGINPGFGGLSEGLNLMGIYRDQWTGFVDMEGNSVAPKTLLFSGDMPVTVLRGGVSLAVIQDSYGFEDNTNVNMGYSYHLDLGPGILGIGLSMNLINRAVDFNKFYPTMEQDPAIPSGEQSSMLVDAGFGLFWQIPETFYIGLSATNIFESKGKELVESSSTSVSFMGDRTFYLTAGYEYQFNNPVFVLQPSLCVMSNIAITQINAGAKLLYNNKFWFGVNYRYQESVAMMAGFKINDIQISYSYDINTLGIAVQGSHEVCVSYFLKLNLEKSPRIYRSIRYL